MPLPAGYSLDTATGGSAPPAGYTLDQNYSPPKASGGDASGASLFSDLLKYSPVGVIKGIADALRDPKSAVTGMLKANGDLWDKTKDAYNKGDYAGAAAHFVNYLVPGGSAMEDAGEDFQNGQYAHGLAKTAGIASSVEAGAKAPEILSAAGDAVDVAPKVLAAAAQGVKAAAPDVASGAAKALAGEVIAKVPGMEWPARIGLQYPAVRQIGKGFTAGVDAFKDGLADPIPDPAAAKPVAKPIPAPPPGPVQAAEPVAPAAEPAAASPLPPSQNAQLLQKAEADGNKGAADFYKKKVDAEQSPQPSDSPEVAAEKLNLLNDLSDSLARGKTFAQLSRGDQDTVRSLARKIYKPVEETAPEPAAPEPPAQPAASVEPQSAAEVAQRHPVADQNRVDAANRIATNLNKLGVAAPAIQDDLAWSRLAQNLGERKGYTPNLATRQMVHERMGTDSQAAPDLSQQLSDSIAAAKAKRAAAAK